MSQTNDAVLDPRFRDRIRESFSRQQAMETIGAKLTTVEPGLVEIELPYRADLTQQDGFLHAGIVATIADTACGYAAATLMPPGCNVLSVEFKINMLRPALGDRFIARGTIVRAGKTITVTHADVLAIRDGEHKLVAAMQATMIVSA